MNRGGKFLGPLILTAVVLSALFASVSLRDLEQVFHSISWTYFILAAALFFGINVIRTVRFQILSGAVMPFKTFLAIVSVHSFLSNNLPARLGELSYIYLVGKTRSVGTARNIGSLIAARIFDAAIVSLFAIMSLFMIPHANESIITTMIGGIAISLLVFALFLWKPRWIAVSCQFFFTVIRQRGRPFFNKLQEKIFEVAGSIEEIRRGHLFGKVFLVTVVLWLVDFLFNWLLINGSGLSVSYQEIVFIFVLPIVASLLPIQPIGNFGLFEISLLGGLLFMGFTKDLGLSVALTVHLATIIISFIMAAMGITFFFIKKKSSEPRTLKNQSELKLYGPNNSKY